MSETFGDRLQAARRRAGYRTQESLGDMVGVSGRMIRHYEHDRMPPPDVLQKLREVLGDFDTDGDPVEVALRQSELTDWRQDAVRSVYRRNLSEQRAGEAG